MQKSNTPKNGTGASLRRRKFLEFVAVSTAAMPSMASAAVSPKSGRLIQASAIDPIWAAIKEFEDGLAAFEAMPPFRDDMELEAAIEATYGPAMRRLDKWEAPALTRAGATSALRLAVKEDEGFEGSPLTTAMIKAALVWLEGGAA